MDPKNPPTVSPEGGQLTLNSVNLPHTNNLYEGQELAAGFHELKWITTSSPAAGGAIEVEILPARQTNNEIRGVTLASDAAGAPEPNFLLVRGSISCCLVVGAHFALRWLSW